jgi:hypothetical protein
MAVIEGGASAALIDVGAATLAGRIQIRPTDVGSLGSYSIAAESGTMAAGLGAAAPIYSMRWGDSTRAMLLRRVGIQAKNLTTAFAAGLTLFDIIFARSFTASDTGGTSILPTGNSQKRRTSFGTTLITDLRISSTATLTAGTRTLDGAALNHTRGFVPATSVNYPFVGKGSLNIPGASTVAYNMDWHDLFALDISNEWPLVFVQNEGFVIRATVPGTGTWTFNILMEWSEVLTTAGYN